MHYNWIEIVSELIDINAPNLMYSEKLKMYCLNIFYILLAVDLLLH